MSPGWVRLWVGSIVLRVDIIGPALPTQLLSACESQVLPLLLDFREMSYHSHDEDKLNCDITTLRYQLRVCSIESAVDNKIFVPADCLERALSDENITEELRRYRIADDAVTSYICREAGKTFLTLVSISETGAIEQFMRRGFTDANLPISLERISNADNALSVFKHLWAKEPDRIHDFCEHQWKFMAPVFDREQYRYDPFDPKVILPFTHRGPDKPGGFSVVYQVLFHPAHFPQPV